MINIFRPGQSIIDLTGTIDFHIRLSQGIKWLLRDDFTDTRAAGSVDGTPAVPGPGTRYVVDTGNKLSTDGEYLLLNQAVTYGNPGIWYDLMPRAVGRILIARLNTVSGGSDAMVGFDNNRTMYVDRASFDLNNSGLRSVAAGPVFANVIANTFYDHAVILKSTGCYLFMKGDAFTKWTLMYVSPLYSDANLYPGLGGAGKFVIKVDYMRIPDELWLPTPLAYDTFTRSDGALGSTETSGPDGQVTPSLLWSNKAGTSQISSNSIITTATDGAKAIATVPAGADVLVSIALTRGSGTPGIVFRYKDALNYCYAIHNGTNVQLHKVVNGTDTTLVNAAAAYGDGYILHVNCLGSKIWMFYNNKVIGTEQTVSDGDLQSGTGVGWYTTDTDSKGDNFTVFARGTGGEYDAALNRYIA